MQGACWDIFFVFFPRTWCGTLWNFEKLNEFMSVYCSRSQRHFLRRLGWPIDHVSGANVQVVNEHCTFFFKCKCSCCRRTLQTHSLYEISVNHLASSTPSLVRHTWKEWQTGLCGVSLLSMTILRELPFMTSKLEGGEGGGKKANQVIHRVAGLASSRVPLA